MSLLAEDIYDSEIYPAEVEKMDSEITGVMLLETLSAIMLIPNLVVSYEFLIFGSLDPFSYTLSLAHVILSDFILLFTFYITWAFWTIKPWARRYGIYTCIMAICFSLSPITIVLNIFLLVILRGETMKRIFP